MDFVFIETQFYTCIIPCADFWFILNGGPPSFANGPSSQSVGWSIVVLFPLGGSPHGFDHFVGIGTYINPVFINLPFGYVLKGRFL